MADRFVALTSPLFLCAVTTPIRSLKSAPSKRIGENGEVSKRVLDNPEF